MPINLLLIVIIIACIFWLSEVKDREKEQQKFENTVLALEPQYAESEFINKLLELISRQYQEPKEGQMFQFYLSQSNIVFAHSKTSFYSLNFENLPDTAHLVACSHALARQLEPAFSIEPELDKREPIVRLTYKKEKILKSTL